MKLSQHIALCRALDLPDDTHPDVLSETARMQRRMLDAIQRDANIALEQRRGAFVHPRLASAAELRRASARLSGATMLTPDQYTTLRRILGEPAGTPAGHLLESARMLSLQRNKARRERDEAIASRDTIQRDANVALEQRRQADSDLRTVREQLIAKTAELDDVRSLVEDLGAKLGLSWDC